MAAISCYHTSLRCKSFTYFLWIWQTAFFQNSLASPLLVYVLPIEGIGRRSQGVGRGKGILLLPVAPLAFFLSSRHSGPQPRTSCTAAPHLLGAEDGHAEHQLCTFQWAFSQPYDTFLSDKAPFPQVPSSKPGTVVILPLVY